MAVASIIKMMSNVLFFILIFSVFYNDVYLINGNDLGSCLLGVFTLLMY